MPVENECGPRVLGELEPLAALVAREEAEPAVAGVLQQHHPRRRRAVARRRCERHRLRQLDARGARLRQPRSQLCDRVGVEIALVERPVAFVVHEAESMLGPVKLLVVATALAALTAAPAHAAKPACGPAAAKRAVAAANLRMKLLGDSPVRVDPASVDQVLCHDFTRDGRLDLAVTIASGGTAGDIGFAVLRATPTGNWRVALARSGYKLGLFRLGGDIVELPADLPQERPELLSDGRLRPRALPLERQALRGRAQLAHPLVPPVGARSTLERMSEQPPLLDNLELYRRMLRHPAHRGEASPAPLAGAALGHDAHLDRPGVDRGRAPRHGSARATRSSARTAATAISSPPAATSSRSWPS